MIQLLRGLCPECLPLAQAWIDSKPVQGGISIPQIGHPTEKSLAADRVARWQGHRYRVRTQIDVIREICQRTHPKES